MVKRIKELKQKIMFIQIIDENKYFAVIDQGYKYLYSAINGDELLFNLREDPHELHDLSKRNPNLLSLNGDLKRRFKEDIADVRNKYMHSSNQFPRENEVNALTNTIRECLQAVLNLRI